jgi:hypothetical protein
MTAKVRIEPEITVGISLMFILNLGLSSTSALTLM